MHYRRSLSILLAPVKGSFKFSTFSLFSSSRFKGSVAEKKQEVENVFLLNLEIYIYRLRYDYINL